MPIAKWKIKLTEQDRQHLMDLSHAASRRLEHSLAHELSVMAVKDSLSSTEYNQFKELLDANR